MLGPFLYLVCREVNIDEKASLQKATSVLISHCLRFTNVNISRPKDNLGCQKGHALSLMFLYCSVSFLPAICDESLLAQTAGTYSVRASPVRLQIAEEDPSLGDSEIYAGDVTLRDYTVVHGSLWKGRSLAILLTTHI